MKIKIIINRFKIVFYRKNEGWNKEMCNNE